MLKNPKKFYEEAAAGFDGLFDWDYLIEPVQRATKRGIMPSDIDCHFEVGGHHLIFETKSEGAEVPGGQRQALLQLWAKGYHTVVFLWGKKEPMRWEVYYPSGRRHWRDAESRGKESADVRVEDLQGLMFRWATWADAHPAPWQWDGG